MITIQDWMAVVPPEDRSIAYVGEGDAVQRHFLVTGDGWERYTDWDFHLDMAFDLSSVTTREIYESETTTATTQKDFSENRTEEQSESITDTTVSLRGNTQSGGENAQTASSTKEKRTITRVTVADVAATDIAWLDKQVLSGEGLRLSWCVLRQHTQMPGRLRATLRGVGPAGEIKKSSLMLFEVEPAVVAEPAAPVPVSEFEEMERRLGGLVEEARLCTRQTADDAADSALYREECQQLTAQSAGYVAQALDGVAVAQAAQVQAALAAQSAADSAEEAAGSASSAARSEAQASLRTTEAGTARDQAAASAQQAENAAANACGGAVQAMEYTAAAQTAQAKAEEAAASAAASAALSEWKQHAANAIKGMPIGGAISLNDISPIEHDVKVQVFSKNLIPYPYTLKTNTTQGTVVTDNGDGSITFEGVPDTNFAIDISDSVKVPKSGVYFLSATSYPSDGKLYFIFVNMENGKQFTTADLRAVTLEATTYRVAAVFQKIFFTDNNITTVTLKPQLRLGTTELTYTPYVNPSTVTVKKYGKNLVDIPAITLSGSHNGPIDGGRRLDAVPYQGQRITWQTYVDTSKLSSNYTGSIIAKLFFYREDGTPITSATGNGITIKSNSHISYISFSVPNDAAQVSLFVLITVAPNDGESVTFKENMLSIGDGVAEYEPYKEPTTFTVAADGTVEGVVSSDLYPDATLVPDTHGVNIAAEYNKDTDKVIQSLVDAIISLGGNV